MLGWVTGCFADGRSVVWTVRHVCCTAALSAACLMLSESNRFTGSESGGSLDGGGQMLHFTVNLTSSTLCSRLCFVSQISPGPELPPRCPKYPPSGLSRLLARGETCFCFSWTHKSSRTSFLNSPRFTWRTNGGKNNPMRLNETPLGRRCEERPALCFLPLLLQLPAGGTQPPPSCFSGEVCKRRAGMQISADLGLTRSGSFHPPCHIQAATCCRHSWRWRRWREWPAAGFYTPANTNFSLGLYF